ncbi:MAG: hypothetical protein V1855_00305 [bacterium]
MIPKILRFLWGEVSNEEFKKFGILSLALLFIIGTYWIVRPIKDSLFLILVGKNFLSYAKILSLISLGFLLMLYSKLVDWFEKHHLVYFLNSVLGLFLFFIAFIITNFPEIYTQRSFMFQFIGWIFFVGSESLLVLQFSLFWSFVSSSVDTATAKKGYPLIVAAAQLGAIAGPLLTLRVSSIGIAPLLFIAGFCMLGSALVIKIFTLLHHQAFDGSRGMEGKPTGSIEGLRLLMSHPYLIGIFFITMFPAMLGEILNFSMLFLVETSFPTPEKIIVFLGIYGLLVNSASFIFAFFGTSFFLRTWGLAAGLLFYPITIMVVIIYTWVFHSLWTIVIAMIVLKGLEHALDQPCREMMFIPTSKDIMFKAKGWIGAFGGRSARGISAGLVTVFVAMGDLVFYGSLVSLGLIGLWLPAAWYVGKKNNKLVEEGKILT